MSDDTRNVFRKNLLQVMAERDMNQVDLASAIGVSNTTVNNWVLGYNVPKMDRIDDICRVLGVSRTDLLTNGTETSDDLPGHDQYAMDKYDILFKRMKNFGPKEMEKMEQYAEFIEMQLKRESDL